MTIVIPRREHTGAPAKTTLTAVIGPTAASFTIASASGWPDGSTGPFMVILDRGENAEEKVLCLSRTGTTVTVFGTGSGRGFDGTIGQTHQSGASAVHMGPSAEEFDVLNAALSLLANGTKGRFLTNDGTGIVVVTPGADHTTAIYDSTQTSGYRQALIDVAELASSSVTPAKIATSVAGAGLSGGAGTALAVNVDGTSIEINSDILRVKAGGITTNELATNAVTTPDITDANVTLAKLASEAGTAYTPTLSQGASSNISKTVNHAYYWKIGRLVFVSIQLTATAAGTAGSAITCTLPLTAAVNAQICMAASGEYIDVGVNQYHAMLRLASTTTFDMFDTNNAALGPIGTVNGPGGSFAVASTDQLQAHFWYEAAS